MTNKVFLGGTCADTTWREDLIPLLTNVDYFNPVVKDWTPLCQNTETYEKEEECFKHLYVITSAMVGVFSIAEVIDSAHRNGIMTFLNVISDGFSEAQMKSLKAVVDLTNRIGGHAFIDLSMHKLADYLNDYRFPFI